MSDTPRTDAILDQRFDSVLEGSHACTRLCKELERELAAMTAAKELAERQVAVLIPFVTTACPPNFHVLKATGCANAVSCNDCWAEWSRAEAAKGVTK